MDSTAKPATKEEREIIGVVEKLEILLEDEELFEINLDQVHNISPVLHHPWETHVTVNAADTTTTTTSTATAPWGVGHALLANCLLPVTDLSCAMPIM